MAKAQRTRQRLLWALLSLLVGLVIHKIGLPAIRAQEVDEHTGAHQLFLPYVADGVATTVVTAPGDGHTHTHPQPQRESWPPQPEGLSAVVWLANAPSAAVIAAEQLVQSAAQQALTTEPVQAALGERFIQATAAYVHPKEAGQTAIAGRTAPKAVVRVTYFSYSHNATVEALVADGVVTAVRTLPAAVYQPEPTASEKVRAVDIARRYFADQGVDRIQVLEGYVIQAYQPAGETGFYENRVLYVTFHERIDERPEFVAWVDLTHEVVSKGFQDQYQPTPNEEAQ